MRTILFIILLTSSLGDSNAQCFSPFQSTAGKILGMEVTSNSYKLRSLIRNGAAQNADNPRFVAICLDITLGLFGMHRLYLGTDLMVPIAYTFTIGGGGILWIADLVLLITAKDITPFMNNPNMFMWQNTRE